MDNKVRKNKVEFEKLDIPFYRVENLKEITLMAWPIFLQLIFNIFIAQINLLAINWYNGGVYSTAVSKAVLTYNTLQFIPSLISTGTLVVAGNLIGQGKQDKISSVVITGLVINFTITLIIFSFIEGFSDHIVTLMKAENTPIKDGEVILNNSELRFVSTYYRILNINLLFLSLSQVYIAGLQSIKKTLQVSIGAICANVVDVIVVTVILYGTNINPVYSALSLPITGIFQLTYMMIVSHIYIDYKKNKGNQWNINFAKETLKIGLPITLEMGVWYICNFAMGITIASLKPNDPTNNEWLVLHRNITSIAQYSAAFTQAMGTVTAVFVARKIGQNDIQGAYKEGINCWKVAIYASIISVLFMMALTWPMLKAFGTKNNIIAPWGLISFSLFAIKLLFDTVNMTLLRGLWSCGDLWYPIIVSFFTMGLGMVALPFTIVYGFNITGPTGLLLVYLVLISDPLLRSSIYFFRWINGKWVKYTRQIKE